MAHSRNGGWPSIAIAVGVLALGLVGVALAGGTNEHGATTQSVNVTFTDTRLSVSHGVVQAGQATFVIANNGRKPHTLSISGPGFAAAKTQPVKPGRTGKLTVTLKTGAYMLADRVPRGGSMTVKWLMVGPAAASTGNSRDVTPFPAPAPMDCD